MKVDQNSPRRADEPRKMERRYVSRFRSERRATREELGGGGREWRDWGRGGCCCCCCGTPCPRGDWVCEGCWDKGCWAVVVLDEAGAMRKAASRADLRDDVRSAEDASTRCAAMAVAESAGVSGEICDSDTVAPPSWSLGSSWLSSFLTGFSAVFPSVSPVVDEPARCQGGSLPLGPGGLSSPISSRLW